MPDPKKEDIFEESTYTVTATIKSGVFKTKYKGKLDLIYKSGDEELHKDPDVDVSKGQVQKDYLVPKVKPTDDKYVLKIIAKYGKSKEKTLVLTEATVWPKSVKLTVKDTESKAVGLVAFKVNHDTGDPAIGNTDESGIGNANLRKCPHTIGIKAPWEVVSDKNDTNKREHEIVVRKNMKAKILKPDLTQDCYVAATGGDKTAGVRQYVNTATTQNGCDAAGSVIEFEVACEKLSDGQQNDKIYIKVEFSKNSKRNLPLPGLQPPVEAIQNSGDGKTFKGYVTLSSDGGTAKFQLQLGYAGGETFKVSCGYSKDDPSDDTQTFITWRKLGYQLRYAQMFTGRLTPKTRADSSNYMDLPDSVFSVFKARLEKVFVEYENINSISFANPAAHAPCMVTKGFLEASADNTPVYVLDGSQNWTAGAAGFDAITDQREIHITLCDRAFSSNGAEVNPKPELTAAVSDMKIYEPAPNKPSYVFLKKNHTKVDEINIRVDGLSWVAAMDKVLDADKNQKATFAITDANGNLGLRTFSVSEPSSGGPAIQVTLAVDGSLPASEKTKIQSYYEACYSNAVALRLAANALSFVVTGPSGGDADAWRSTIKSALTDVDTASALKTLYHNGLDENGVPRKGDMTDITIDHYCLTKIKVSLPTRAADTDPMAPGDYVGPASSTKCPVSIEFIADGTNSINGNAGGGSQLLVLKETLPGPCAATVCHELGHSMGMTAMPATGAQKYPTPPGLVEPKHVDNGGWLYRNKAAAPYTDGYRNLHVGGHCCNGMPGGKKADPKFTGWVPGATDDVCIMWGSGGSADNRSKYCDDCTTILKARKLDDIRSGWWNRTDP